ncbi:MAG: signal peptidase II [Solirubrobacterales bacterium]|nr:signal peptidase II [Solirubrobacterales bacterium]
MAATSAARERSTRRTPAFARALALAALVVIADRITKHAIKAGIAVGAEHKLIPGLRLVHVRNTGVAFNFLAGGGALVLVITLAALAALLGYFARRPTRRGLWVPTGLLVGGALGNLIDRIVSGSVTDFIKLPHWPAFNVSDIAITVGVVALLWVIEHGGRAQA